MVYSKRSVLFLTLFVLGTALLHASANPCPVHDLPHPTGKYPVGTSVLPVQQLKAIGTSRQVQLWYPATSNPHGRAAAYVPDPSILASLRSEKFLNLPDCVFDYWQTMTLPAKMNVPIARVPNVPFVLIAPGAGVSRISYSYYAEQLASDGYIVATLDFGEGGFLVQEGKLLAEGPSAKDESDYAKQAEHMAAHISDLLDEFLLQHDPPKSALVRRVVAHIDRNRLVAIGHSLGGAAALDVCLSDRRVKACIDLDGIPESPVAEQGIKTSALMLRSHPDYSDADLIRLHRDPVEWKAKGARIEAETAKLLASPGPDAWIISIHGTGHMSYSDAPYTMAGTLTRFGGSYLDPGRVLSITTGIVEEYLQHVFAGAAFSIARFPEATIQTSRQSTF
jgi:pimeloyl-ACP methyl ester carboxylesterase